VVTPSFPSPWLVLLFCFSFCFDRELDWEKKENQKFGVRSEKNAVVFD
jgi:hypothetical protein